ncbi:DNA glycosylase [Coniella lustricola]|uniref:Adenine DNA glycosylase n=1 Tax=Coniella lustricola TaxID=2025994 RepID=A0A2T2ZSW2_9PEZI|nr:DNA glycosylase [Coniella lustricola]
MASLRQSSRLASERIRLQAAAEQTSTTSVLPKKTRIVARPRPAKRVTSDDMDDDEDASDADADTLQLPQPPAKRRKSEKSVPDLHQRLFDNSARTSTDASICRFPLRQHRLDYHQPLLLQGDVGRRSRADFLQWYDGVSNDRAMPWRKPFIDPKDYQDADELRRAQTQRAYEVFISEIMLQQTRVKVVIGYWTRWMQKWPTIYDLAKATEDEVMSVWRGLGYYSRCKRILAACKLIVEHSDWRGLMPYDVNTLKTQVPGVGPYTAGAISCIVFGRPAPMVDGNVLRVLSRQLGLLVDTKTDKTAINLIWACAAALVETVSLDMAAAEEDNGSGKPQPTDGPGKWGQALMELGSTICTPQPNCLACPITATCRAYQEGETIAATPIPRPNVAKQPDPLDVEDLCHLCEPFECLADTETAAEPTTPVIKKAKQTSLSAFFAPGSSEASEKKASRVSHASAALSKIAISHAQKFPVKTAKKAVPEQETLVCAIQRADSKMYLIQKRPNTGLLAGMWEFPSHILPEMNDSTPTARKRIAREFAASLFRQDDDDSATAAVSQEQLRHNLVYHGELGTVPWVFSHLKLRMHVQLFTLSDVPKTFPATSSVKCRWASSEAVEGETMGTGMRKCWKLVADKDC